MVGADPPADGKTETPDASLLDLVAVLVRRRRAVIGVPFALGVLTAAVSLVLPQRYTAVTTFIPEVSSQRQLPAGLAGIAGQIGLNLGGAATYPPRFFADVLKSRALTDRMLLTRFPDPRSDPPGDSIPLLTLFPVKAKNLTDSLEKVGKQFSQTVGVRVDAQTNELTLTVTSRYPVLAASVANRFISYLNDFNTKSRQTKGRDRREFTENRLAETGQQLRTLELQLKNFYEANRSWQQSPQLAYEEGRQRRQVQVVNELFLTLSREYEQARIDEVNDTPGITVIDSAVTPQERSWPKRKLLVLMALVLGTMAGVTWALGAEYLVRLRASDPEGYAALRALIPSLRRAGR